MSARTGLVPWAVAELGRVLPQDEVEAAAAALASPAELNLRTNTCRVTRDALLAALAAAGHPAEPGITIPTPSACPPPRRRRLPGYREGWFAVQDEASAVVTAALWVQPGSGSWTRGAAPAGSPPTWLCLAGDGGLVVAADVSPGEGPPGPGDRRTDGPAAARPCPGRPAAGDTIGLRRGAGRRAVLGSWARPAGAPSCCGVPGRRTSPGSRGSRSPSCRARRPWSAPAGASSTRSARSPRRDGRRGQGLSVEACRFSPTGSPRSGRPGNESPPLAASARDRRHVLRGLPPGGRREPLESGPMAAKISASMHSAHFVCPAAAPTGAARRLAEIARR